MEKEWIPPEGERWLPWEMFPPGLDEWVEICRTWGSSAGEPVIIRVSFMNPAFNVAGLYWRHNKAPDA